MKGVVVCIMLLAMFLGATSFILPAAGASEPESYTPHEPISINGDDDFAAQAAS